MSLSTEHPKPLRQRRKEARPSELTAAALALFVEKGFAATKLDEIAARAGVSKGTLYLYFDNKEALFIAVIREGFLPLIEDAEARLASLIENPEGMLREILHTWWQSIGTTPLGGVIKLIMAESQNFPEVSRFHYENVVARGMGLASQAIQRGIDIGRFRPVNVAHMASLLFIPAVHAAIWQSTPFCPESLTQDPTGYIDTHLDIFMRGLRVCP